LWVKRILADGPAAGSSVGGFFESQRREKCRC
jgi:hypothetical protein